MSDLSLAASASPSSAKKSINIGRIKHDGSTRRFYDAVSVAYKLPEPGAEQSSGWVVTLADRPIETPAERPFVLPTQRLAQAVALEWEAQLSAIRYSTMPITNLAIVAIDRVRPDPAEFIDKFNPVIALDNALLRVEEPTALSKLQRKHWDPLLRHLSSSYSLELQPTFDFAPPSSDAHQSRLRAILAAQDEWTLAALDSVASLSKSLVVALCVLDGRLSVEQAYEAARVEENYQMRLYGTVSGVYGHTIDIEWTRMVMAAARTLVNLARPPKEEALVVDNTAQP